MIVVLPTPGPPVTTSTFAVTAWRIASRWAGASSRPIFFSTHCRAASVLSAGSGWPPSRSFSSERATPTSAKNSGLR